MLDPAKAFLNKKRSLKILKDRGATVVMNETEMVIVDTDWDYIPSTGWFRNRVTKQVGRGVWNLILELKKK